MKQPFVVSTNLSWNKNLFHLCDIIMDDEKKQWCEDLKRERKELKIQREETDRVIRKSREMDAKLMENGSLLKAWGSN